MGHELGALFLISKVNVLYISHRTELVLYLSERTGKSVHSLAYQWFVLHSALSTQYCHFWRAEECVSRVKGRIL